jgi:hypothetical protein
MIYKITFKVDDDNIQELEDIFDKYDIEYEVNEIYEEV